MKRRLLALVVAFLIILAGELTWKLMLGRVTAGGAAAKTSSNAHPVPVTVGVAKRGNVPVYLTGLGTVQAFNTVTVNSRVDGELTKVAFAEGQNVRAGDVLAQIDPRSFQAALALAQATKEKDEAQLANTRIDLQRFQKSPLSSTQQQIDTQAALVKQLVATVHADEANVDAAKVQLDYTTIKAPLSGRTGVRLVDQGNIVHAASTTGLVVITQLEPISVVFTLPQDQLQEVISQMGSTSSSLKVVALGRGDTQRLDEGTLAIVDNQIDQTTGSVRFKATFPNKDQTLWPGQYVNVQLLLKTLPQVVTVPSAAIQRGPNGMYVYTVKSDSTVSIQPVDVSEMTNGTSVIDKGLDPGTKIVVAGQYRLEPGSRIHSTSTARLASEK